MAEIVSKEITDEKVWERFTDQHPEANFLQSWLWGEFHKTLGHQTARIGFYEDEKLVGIMLVIIERAKRGKYVVVPGGPILDWNNENIVQTFVSELKSLCRKNNCSFARVRPQLIDSEENRDLFKKLGFKKAPMYLHAELTSQLDITKSEEELLSQMRKTTRYEIKKAQSLGIKISDAYNPETIKTFIELQDETAKRQKFVPFTKDFLIKQFEVFIKNDLAKLYTARLGEKILAQAFIIFYGMEAVYHYGASTSEGRQFPGAYLIQWEAIKEAKKRSLIRYNFWGVAPVNSSDHRFSGLSLFKRGFGGDDIAYLSAQDLIVNPKKYFINFVIEKIRRRLRNV